MSGIVQFFGIFATDWLTPQECRAAKSDVQLYRVRDVISVVIPGHGTFTIPRGFVTDLGSVPAIAQSYVGTEHPSLNVPAAFHDRLYFTQEVPREVADECFYRMLLAQSMRPSQAWVLWKAVRIGGASHYGKKS